MRRSLLAVTLVLSAAGCATTSVSVDESRAPQYGGASALARARSLAGTVDALVAAGGNGGREKATLDRIHELGLARYARKSWIDWWTPSDNVVVEVPAEVTSGFEPLVLVVAHYDKADVRPDAALSRLFLGALEPLLSTTYLTSGAIDDASGCAVALELAREIADCPRSETYRFLLLGAQESGLRGARCYLASLSPRDLRRVRLVVSLDSVGVRDEPNGVLESVDHPELVEAALRAAANHGFPLTVWTAPTPFCGDDEPFAQSGPWSDLGLGLFFNGLGGLLPQRSWFTTNHRLPTITFASPDVLGTFDALAYPFLPLPLGQIHGPRDDPSRLDPWRLYEQLEIVREMTEPPSAQPATAPAPATTAPTAPPPPAVTTEVEASGRR